ncbi:Cof-type HAD-IIB family hydrolase [Clostridium massiliamazoniense]|uniref:Cof-type HAD-IIB family hydrolase n=1 Tax=Clostridium massiliamazoniense TaxID=1347366 RepID=UPI0006D854D9|nr:Cof-type HAD-IIB family hydrolase [Clostridium massiliamazoniense]
MNKGIVFFDADGTIIKNNKISKLTREAFTKLRENGYILVLSTGRALPAIDGILKDMNFENIICSAGGAVVVNNEIIYSKPMKKESLKELVEYFDKYNIIYNMEANDYIWIKKGQKEKYLRLFEIPEKGIISDDEYNKAVERLTMISNRTMEIEDVSNLEVNKIHYYEADVLYDGNELPISYKQVVEELGEKYKCVSLSLSKLFSGGEICEKEISKKTGMDVILKYFDVDKENIYAIGDDYNDIEMLEYAPKSIAMGNAPEEIKKICSYITESVDNDGFYHAMKHFGLI